MKRVHIFSIFVNVICLIFANSLSDYNNLLLPRPPGNVLYKEFGNGLRIAASSIIVDCHFEQNTHFIIRINEDDDGPLDDIPSELTANGPETSEELFEIVTFKTAKAPRTSTKATHVFCDANNENCRYYDFSRN